MPKVKLTALKSECRCGTCKTGDEFVVEDLCPPLCHELWYVAYPYVLALQSGGVLDYGGRKTRAFDVKCPDEGRVALHGELTEGFKINTEER